MSNENAALSSRHLTADDIPVGSVWEVSKRTAERWEILADHYDGAGTFRVVLLDADGERTQQFDTVWANEILTGATRVR